MVKHIDSQHWHPLQESLVVMPLRGYQRHCIAVARHEVNPEAVGYIAQLYSVLLVKARAAAKAGANHQVFQSIANTIAYMEGGDVSKALWRHIESMVPFDGKSSSQMEAMKVEHFHLIHLHAVLLSQSLGVMTSDELKGSDAPLCKHDLAPYVAKVTALTSWIAWSPASPASLQISG
ncbi:unnamed protein product [Durusdinium trenchii]|uniref:Uncharacterized protein n=1 Tax=Durusdinium trenchii TaxID=1381693 RepID=A0ABP0RT25_9DINO